MVMGVSGSGKTTIGKKMAFKLKIPFYDGDDFHPEANIEKMKSGQPLNDDDREPWLISINQFAKSKLEETSLIVACSALKAKYRTTLSIEIPTVFVYLKGTAELIRSRMEKRKGHFMPSELLASQFKTLEEPRDAIVVDIDQSPDEIADRACLALYQKEVNIQ